MKAQVYHYIGQDRLELMNLPDPEPAPGEVRVSLHCAGVNPIDWKCMAGVLSGIYPYTLPAVPGWDGSGVIDQVGPDVKGWSVGDEVLFYGRSKTIGHNGTYAEYACFAAEILAPKPVSMSWAEAAAIPLASLTGWQALVKLARLKKGDTVVIPAAAGGVGAIAVQLARHLGARVIGTCSQANLSYVASLGVDEVFDYTCISTQLPQGIADCLIGTLPVEGLRAYLGCLRSGGLVIPLSGHKDLVTNDFRVEPLFTSASGDELQEMVDLFVSGALTVPPIDSLPLEQANIMLDRSRSGHGRGKRVLTIV